jgi:hypothetical protein
MATDMQLQVIDAHAHVIETEPTWDFLQPIDGKQLPEDVSRASHMFVTCQTDNDLLWRLQVARKHSVIINTDHGHTDPSSQLDAIFFLKQKPEIYQDTKSRTVCHHCRTLYHR